jgi:hypothetical protein
MLASFNPFRHDSVPLATMVSGENESGGGTFLGDVATQWGM